MELSPLGWNQRRDGDTGTSPEREKILSETAGNQQVVCHHVGYIFLLAVFPVSVIFGVVGMAEIDVWSVSSAAYLFFMEILF